MTKPHTTIDLEVIANHLHAAYERPTRVAVSTALADIPVMLAEIQRSAALLARFRLDFANLLAAARASLAAERDGESDPNGYLRDEVAQHRPWTPYGEQGHR
ncbi:hypothetical protein [Actinoplanes sp. NPDC089786]|uniref:hypothetical protein n=1 Tax=Actinoplanes sp. NPDC089786 TaxID=3155185 RepID=UPI0034445E9F